MSYFLEGDISHMRINFLKILKKNIYWRINKYKISKEKEPRYIIKTKLETLNKLLEGYSISRYGDGELSLIYKKKKSGINYQELIIRNTMMI